MTIWDYPITTPFGQVPGYPLNNGFHQGIDYGAPVGTSVTVNGVTIGLSGNTGASTGPHCHVGKWLGAVVQDPTVGGGKIFKNTVVTEINEDSTNGKYVRVEGDGYSWVYLHMSDNSKVKVGQVLKGDSVEQQTPTSTQVGEEFQAIMGRQPRQDELDLLVGLGWFDGQKQYLWSNIQTYRDTITNLENDRDTNLYPYINAVTTALGLPIGATSSECEKAIEALKTGSGTVLKPGTYKVN